MGGAYPELSTQRAAIEKWLAAEEESFGRTLEQGTRLLEELIERALDADEEGIAAADAFELHDTYGFPFDLTRELVAERGLGVDPEGFERLMDAQRARARAAAGGGRASRRRGPTRARARAGGAAPASRRASPAMRPRRSAPLSGRARSADGGSGDDGGSRRR